MSLAGRDTLLGALARGSELVMQMTKKWLRRHWHLFGAFLLLVYFAYHGIHGERGLLAWVDKSRLLEERKQELAQLNAQITDLQSKVTALQPDRADPDLMEEKLRELGYIGKNEMIIGPAPSAAAQR